ncbi:MULTISPECIES: glutaminase A [Metabacillus]|uniref:Glutaminase n=1 Tax=Metabacillus indicus TaxID=246786 RepID=A0A084H3D7_METID|nr:MULTISPECIES: glutaminase A [Metabacillus]KEZ49942.1 glutaminase [Metabacillus indicus LMG 22858]KEZ54099.1 glutaminase [Metabacillus indicus]
MPCKTNEELAELVEEAKKVTSEGKVADYIPELGKAEADDLSVAIYHVENSCMSAGDIEKTFTLQSISKVLTLALVLMDHGEPFVFSKVGMEPTGDPFNSIVKLETHEKQRPLNPMINAGALAVTNMIKGSTKEEKLLRYIDFIRKLTFNKKINICKNVAASEFETAWLNRSLCYFMKKDGIIEGDVEDLIDLYSNQCAIEMHSLDLAKIGAVFALDGKHPETEQQLIPKDIARICKTFMVTCGMYNASGEFAIKVGIPAKSGVSGGIMGIVPYQFGIGIFGPSLDEKGNSIAGIKLLHLLSEKYELSIF